MTLKNRLPSWDELPTEADLAVVGSVAHRELSSRAYAMSVTLARDDDAIPLRLQEADRVLIIAPQLAFVSQAVDIPFAPDVLVEEVRRRHANTSAVTITPAMDGNARQALLDAAHAADSIILVMLNAHLDEHQASLDHDIIAAGRPTIGIAVCDPYDIGAIPTGTEPSGSAPPSGLRTALATYDYTPPALEAVVRVLFGEITPQGHLPISVG